LDILIVRGTLLSIVAGPAVWLSLREPRHSGCGGRKENVMPKTVIGLFDDYQKAQDVMQDLVDSGIEADRISTITEADKSKYSQDTTSTHGPVTTTEHGAGGMSAPVESATRTLLDLGMPENKAKYYAEAVRRGGTLVCVAGVDDGDLDNAVNIIDSHGSVDINNRAAEWRESGWAGVGPEAPEDEVIVVETTYVIVPEERKRAS